MPRDTNPSGDIWGGWLLAQMDLAGEVAARQRARRRVVTVGIEAMEFHRPVKVGDVVSFYSEVVRVGRTSLTVQIIAVAMSEVTGMRTRVTQGRFSFVALDEDGQPTPIAPNHK
ncbi:acyl-CoA thioesterase [Pelagerythrobacter aerophilus]|uniref:Acyl-CoA thioesterase n=2 Tax=Pelagerythrobacter aerophilus TaxID=2306995 RepID=A0A418NI29_9SPHN|nr:acyl-CoA thioesterase [Pelagerythrobacter aerophilus]